MIQNVFVSPHADDVALSCGGQILMNSNRSDDVAILNIFTSDLAMTGPAIRRESKFTELVNAERSKEDRAAWEHLSVRAHYVDLPEAVLRQKFPFAIRHQPEPYLLEQLRDAIGTYADLYPGALFHFPAGIGSHIDHIACANVAFQILNLGIVERVRLYEDTPYSWLRFIRRQYYRRLERAVRFDHDSHAIAHRPSGAGGFRYLGSRTVPFPRGRLLFTAVYLAHLGSGASHPTSGLTGGYRGTVQITRLDEERVREKIALLEHYASQIPMLFGDDPERTFDLFREALSTEISIEIARS